MVRPAFAHPCATAHQPGDLFHFTRIQKKSPRIGTQPVALNCPSNTNVLFHAQTRRYGAQQWKETAHETQISEKADQEAKQMPAGASEFLARLDFLVTFLAMKKVTEKPLGQRDQKFSTPGATSLHPTAS